MAGRSAHLVGVRDGNAHSRLVRAGRDRVGPAAHLVRLARLCRYAGSADVRRCRRPDRSSRSAGDDARDLCGAGGRADDAGAVGPTCTGLCLHGRRRDGHRPPVGPWRARRFGRDHHAAWPVDRGDQHLAHDDGYRAHRRRAERRRIVCRARHGPGLCGDRLPLYHGYRADAVHRGPGKAACGGRGCQRGVAALAAARPQGGGGLCLDHAADAGRAVGGVPRQPDGLSAHPMACCPTSPRRSTAPTRPGLDICRRVLRSARWPARSC